MNLSKVRRRRRRGDERAQLVQEYWKGGQSAEEFARAVGVGKPTLERWLKESGRAATAGGAGSAPRRLVPVMVGPELGMGDHVEVALADGTTLRAPVAIAPSQLEALVAAVRRSC